MGKEILISVKDVYKTYHSGEIDTPVLKGVNFDIYKGNLFVF